MLNYVRQLPSRSPLARRRFVVAATAFSFTLIVLVWIGVLSFGRRPPSEGPETAIPVSASPTPTQDQGTFNIPEGEPGAATPEPQASPLVDVGQISTNLLKAFGEPER